MQGKVALQDFYALLLLLISDDTLFAAVGFFYVEVLRPVDPLGPCRAQSVLPNHTFYWTGLVL